MDEVSNFLSNMDWDGLVTLLLRLASVLLCIVIHEVSHGLAAYRLGDNTAKQRNRLSLNPLKHIDPFGALMMLLVGFGWAKPVPVDMRQFKHPKSGMAITALAGPISNFILAYVALMVAYFSLGLLVAGGAAVSTFSELWLSFCSMTASLSLGLGVFNLIPFPPLDGFKVVGVLLPDRAYYKILRYEFAGTIILMALLWLGVLDTPLYAVRSWLANLLDGLARWPYYLIVS